MALHPSPYGQRVEELFSVAGGLWTFEGQGRAKSKGEVNFVYTI